MHFLSSCGANEWIKCWGGYGEGYFKYSEVMRRGVGVCDEGVSVKVREWRGVVGWWNGYGDGVLVRVKWWLGVVMVCYGRRRWLLRRSKSEFTLEGIWIKLTVHHSWWLRVPRRPIRDGDDDNEGDGDNGLFKKSVSSAVYLFICWY